MKLKFNALFRTSVFLLVALLFWSVWAGAQERAAPTTNAVPDAASTTNLASRLTEFDEDYVSFGLNRVEILRERSLFGQPLWKYLASLIFVFLAFYVSKLLDFLTRIWLKRLSAKTQTRFDDLLLELLNGPVKIVAFVIFLHVGLSVFQWPPVVEAVLSKGLIVIVACSLTYMVSKLIDLLLGVWRKRAVSPDDEQFHKQLFPIIRKSLKVFMIIIAFLVTAQNLGLNITGLIASLSIGGLALGLAAQDTLANLFGAVAVFVDKPFRVGDRIQLDNVDGVVETIGFRSTRVRNQDGHLVTIPNKTIGNATITNIASRPNIRTLMNIGITYDASREKIQEAVNLLNDIFRKHPNTQDVWISFNKFGDFSLNLSVIHWWNNTDYKAYLNGMQEVNLAIKERFDEAGIGFAFPTQTLYLKQDSEWRVGRKAATE
ncbi:MAG TPA: mechanosensitive ion channel family protein [Verrucomicrobiae bacterium]|nr:mechanosensitive ion channel family protein [Verrucomicrobiae bacterium]